MVVEERLVTYINSLETGNTEILDEIEREALRSDVPIIRKEMQTFLKVFLAMKRPARILEVGTAVGFSAILMAEYNPVRVRSSRLKIMKSGFQSRVKILSAQGKNP